MLGGATGTVVNTGTITGGSGVVIGGATLATVTTSGTIAGTAGTAVALGGPHPGGGGSSIPGRRSSSSMAAAAAAFSKSRPRGRERARRSERGGGVFGAASTTAYVSLGSVVNFSALQIDPSATFDGSGALSFATLINQGQINIASSDSLDIGTIASAATTGVIDLHTGGTVTFAGAVANQTLQFNPAGGIAAIDQPGKFLGTIAGFTAAGDAIDLTGLAFAGTTSVGFNSATNILTVTEGGTSATIQLDSEDYTGISWVAQTDASTGTEITVACYCRGTLILTADGEVPVEELAIGDEVVTILGRAVRPIKWIGRRSYGGFASRAEADPAGLRHRRGALADGVPRRDLWVSPNHALYLEGVLIEARDLVNGASVFQAEADRAGGVFPHRTRRATTSSSRKGRRPRAFIDDDSRFLFPQRP